MDGGSSHVTRQWILVGGIYMLLTVAVYGLVTYVAGHIGHWMRTRAAVAEAMRLHHEYSKVQHRSRGTDAGSSVYERARFPGVRLARRSVARRRMAGRTGRTVARAGKK